MQTKAANGIGMNNIINSTYNNIDKKRKIANIASKTAIIGTGAVVAKFAAKDNSCLQKGASAIVGFVAENLNKGLKFVDKKQNLTKNITGVLDKITKSSAKSKAIGLVGIVAALQFLKSIQVNNQVKGMIRGSKETTREIAKSIPSVVEQVKRQEEIDKITEEVNREAIENFFN